MKHFNAKIYTHFYPHFLEFSVVTLTFLFAWFTFIYYPRLVSNYKTGNYPQKPLIAPVYATSQFPIETKSYKIYLDNQNSNYYAVIEGPNLDIYLANRNGAKLALKTALQKENLCDLKVNFISKENLKIPQMFQNNSDCI